MTETGPGRLIWIASYPKSGNTWMRAFLANYLLDRGDGGAVPLLELVKVTAKDANVEGIGQFAERPLVELPPREVYLARQRYLESLAALPTPTLVKTHLPMGAMFDVPFIPGELTRCAIHIVRNPLDLVISYADHMGQSLEEAAEAIASHRTVLGFSDERIPQFLGNWSLHVRSWMEAEGFPLLRLRYEDILDDPVGSFTRALELIGAPVEQSRLERAVAASRFDKLRAQEAAEGFIERQDGQERFFRKGTKGHWRDELPPALAERIVAEHGEVMRALGYL